MLYDAENGVTAIKTQFQKDYGGRKNVYKNYG